MRALKSAKVILALIIIIGVFLRFYKLNEYPIHLNHDEITQLYDAISIAQTGKDIHGNFLPFIFPSLGDYKPPFYTYSTTLFYFLFGWKEIIIRLTGAIFGTLMIPAAYLFVLKLLNNNRVALISAFFTSIAPFEIYFSRKSFENGAGIFLILLGFLFFLKYFDNKRVKWIYCSSIIFAISMYTYFSHAIITPLLILAFIIIYRKQLLPNIRQFLIPALIFISLTFPLILMMITNADVKFRSKTVFVKQDRVLGSLLELNASENTLQNILLQKSTYLTYIFDRYLKQFDPIYLFANGLDMTDQGVLGLGPLLLIQLPFLILGVIFLIKKENLHNEKKFIWSWVLIGMLPSALTFESHSPHRVVMVFTMLNIISATGLYFFLNKLSSFKKTYLLSIIFLFLMFSLNILYSLHIYFVNFPYEKSQYLQHPFKEVSQFIWSEYNNFDSIVFDPQFGDVSPMVGVGGHYYLAFYGHYPPAKFQKEFHTGDKDREVLFDKFSIRHVYWPADKDRKNTLFIVSKWSVPLDTVSQSLIVKRFNFYNGRLAFFAIKL